MQKGYVDNAWVNEQSGITAANGGSIKVANNTDIKGAIIASENKDKAIELDTKTFTYEDIKDKQEGKTVGFGISGGTTGGVPATSIQYASNDKRQDTNATLSNVSLTVNGEKVDPNTIGINTDLSQAQVITKDERIDMIDVNLQTDLANKEERDKIRDAKDKVEDVVETVKNVVDSNNVGGIKENYVNNRFATRGANAVEDDPTLSKMLNELKVGNLDEDEAKDVILAVVKKMYEANGFTGTPDIKFETGIGGEEGTDGARGTETGTIYFDIEKIKAAMTDKDTGGTGALIGLIAHESSHSEKYGETTGNLLIEEGFADSKEELARDKFKETDKTLSEEEKEKALAKIKDEVKDERAISDSLTISSKDEDIEGKNRTIYINGIAYQEKDLKQKLIPSFEDIKKMWNNKELQKDAKGIGKIIASVFQKPSNALDIFNTPLGGAIYNQALDSAIEYKDGKYSLNEQKLKSNLNNVQQLAEFIAIEAPNFKFTGTIDDAANSILSKLKSDPKMKTNPQAQLLLENKKAGQLLVEWNGKSPIIPKGGTLLNGREYSEHALERMAPNTPEVKAELTMKAVKLAEQKKLIPQTKEYNDFINKYVDPRGIPVSVIEDTIKTSKPIHGNTEGTWEYSGKDVKVILNNSGKVITVIPK